MEAPINTQLVGVQGDDIVIMKRGLRLSKQDALSMAAWIVAIADDGTFQEILTAVQNT